MSDRQELDERLSAGLRKWFDRDLNLFDVPAKARDNLVLTINLAFSEGISAGIDLGAAACRAGIARGTREAVGIVQHGAGEARDHTGVRPCDETGSEQC